MTVTPSDPIIGPPRGSVEQCLAYVDGRAFRESEVDAYVREVYRLAPLVGINPLIIVSQSCHETNLFTSTWWLTRANPAGIGITGDPAQNEASGTWANGTDAARAHIVHMCAYVYGNLSTPLVIMPLVKLDPRWSAVHAAGFDGTVRTISDLAGKWAVDPDYAAGICKHANAILATKGAPSPMALYSVVGLPGPGIELPVPLSHDIISTAQTNQRPGIARETPGYWVQHETANPNLGADAAMHNRWLHGGADGAQLSFHFAVDDGAIYQMIPIDEVTWQAADGAGPGNMSGISCELCVNAGIDTAKARHNAEALAGGVLKALGMGSGRVKRHWDFNAADPNRHHCPDRMMSEGYWPMFVAHVADVIAGGKPHYAKRRPVPLPYQTKTIDGHLFVKLASMMTTTCETPLHEFADPASALVDKPLPKGKRLTVAYVVAGADGRLWGVSKGGARFPLDNLVS